jgi:hypothetical protein
VEHQGGGRCRGEEGGQGRAAAAAAAAWETDDT